ncbi:hypothetical protein VZT92_011895 [Zoarces viviparus]|uniref:Uncharacterized protein n=1 Tax=Zoarces viviparus TaxID=48416 RepID=A0AAW1F674_ZOAVI
MHATCLPDSFAVGTGPERETERAEVVDTLLMPSAHRSVCMRPSTTYNATHMANPTYLDRTDFIPMSRFLLYVVLGY